MGVDVLELDPARPFSAARARNEGSAHLLSRNDAPELVQFIDGDCELIDGWIERASQLMMSNDRTAIVCGVLREREPHRSIYNRLCEMEWAGETGEIEWCGGIFMVRAAAFEEVGGLRATMIAGEEPEFCTRLRAVGWSIRRMDAEMAIHDAAMTRFGQWWKRASRAGHAWAERAALHGRAGDPAAVRQVASILAWGLALPLFALAAATPTQGLSLVAFASYPAQWLRIARLKRRRGFSRSDSTLYALFTIIDKFAALGGIARYGVARLLQRPARLIEHKRPSISVRAAK